MFCGLSDEDFIVPTPVVDFCELLVDRERWIEMAPRHGCGAWKRVGIEVERSEDPEELEEAVEESSE
jgi:hypothetical protein